MKHIDEIRKLMKQSKSISEFTDALKNADIPAWGTTEADESFKKEHGINVNEKWYRYFVETDSTPINQWENLPHYTVLIIRDDLSEMRIIDKS
jgi:tRNA U38,U39,U40 pseudouridine synthase TruA